MRNIKRYLRHYECHETPEHMEETIAECRMIVRNSIVSVHSRSGFMEFLSEVFRMNGVIILGGQISTLIVVCLIIRMVNDYPKLIPMFIPFFILAALPILFRAEIYRMGEIELATRNSCAQLLLARLIIIGAADIVCFTLLLAVEVFLFHTGQGLINLILYVFVPYMLCVAIILRLIRIGRHGFTSCIGMAIIVSVLWGIMASLIPNLYTASAIGVWMICFIVFGLFFSYEIKNLISIVKEGTAYGFDS